MDIHDSYGESSPSWVVTTEETKVSGSVGVTIVESLGLVMASVGETKLNCNTLWGKWTCLQRCKQGCKTAIGTDTTRASIGLGVGLGSSGNANANSFSWRGREIYLGQRRMYTNSFSTSHLTSNYLNKVYIICSVYQFIL